MLASVNKFVCWSAALALLAVLPAASGAREEQARARQAGEERWVPSLALTSGITIQKQEGSVTLLSSLTGLDEDFSTDGDDLAVSPYVGANLQLMSPALPLPGRPRLFLGAEILPTFPPTRDVAKTGSPSDFYIRKVVDPHPWSPVPGESPPPLENPLAGYNQEAILGVGSVTTTEIDTLVFGAGMGVAFPFELRGRPLRLKPSFGWIRYKVDAEGALLKAQCPLYKFGLVTSTACITFDPSGPFVPDPPPGYEFYSDPTRNHPLQPGLTREIVIRSQGSQSYNGIGGGLELEMDTGRVGPFGVSLFLGAGFYRILGKRRLELSASASFEEDRKNRPWSEDDPLTNPYPPPTDFPPPPGGYNYGTNAVLPAESFTADWSFEVDPWMYRWGLGLRLHWLGSQK